MDKEDFEKLLHQMHTKLKWDGCGWWFGDWCIKEGDLSPSFEEFKETLILKLLNEKT